MIGAVNIGAAVNEIECSHGKIFEKCLGKMVTGRRTIHLLQQVNKTKTLPAGRVIRSEM